MARGCIKFRRQGKSAQGGFPGVVGHQERRRVSPQVAAENADHLRLAGLGGQKEDPGRGLAGKVPAGMGHDAAVHRGPRGQGRRPHDKVFDFRLAGADAGGIPAHGQHPVPGSHGRLLLWGAAHQGWRRPAARGAPDGGSILISDAALKVLNIWWHRRLACACTGAQCSRYTAARRAQRPAPPTFHDLRVGQRLMSHHPKVPA